MWTAPLAMLALAVLFGVLAVGDEKWGLLAAMVVLAVGDEKWGLLAAMVVLALVALGLFVVQWRLLRRVQGETER